MEILKGKFEDIKKGKEGIVIIGAGGDLQQWLEGVTDMLNKEKIVKGTAEEIWDNPTELKSTGGRTDLLLYFKKGVDFNMSKMAMWRLRFGNCSWISDFLVNYEEHYNLMSA